MLAFETQRRQQLPTDSKQIQGQSFPLGPAIPSAQDKFQAPAFPQNQQAGEYPQMQSFGPVFPQQFQPLSAFHAGQPVNNMFIPHANVPFPKFHNPTQRAGPVHVLTSLPSYDHQLQVQQLEGFVPQVYPAYQHPIPIPRASCPVIPNLVS